MKTAKPTLEGKLRKYPALDALLTRAAPDLVDVGARGGALGPLRFLAPYARYVAVEPDPEAARDLVAALREEAEWRDVLLVPEAFDGRTGDATLHVTRQPGFTSLLPPDPDVARRFFRAGELDVTKRLPVRALTLADAAARYGFREARFLKLDVQGAELAILRSGEALVRDAVAAVYVESLFHPLYAGQSLWADVDAWLRERSFELFDLHRSFLRRAAGRGDHASRRQVTWAHALYFRAPADDEPVARAAARLGLALAFDHFDYALEVVRRRPLDRTADLADEVAAYVRRRSAGRPAASDHAKDRRHGFE